MVTHLVLPTHRDKNGKLTVIEKILPFEVKRVFYIYEGSGQRGGHKHRECYQAIVVLKGRVSFVCQKQDETTTFTLSRPDEIVVIPPGVFVHFHMEDSAILMVLASHEYDEKDYIHG